MRIGRLTRIGMEYNEKDHIYHYKGAKITATQVETLSIKDWDRILKQTKLYIESFK